MNTSSPQETLRVFLMRGVIGGTEFVIQAWLLTRRRRHMASAAPVPSTS